MFQGFNNLRIQLKDSKVVQGFLWTGLIWLTTGFATAQKAESLLEKAAAVYEHSTGIEAEFAVSIRGESQGLAESFEGTIRMKGDKFVWITPDARTWYDGATQWSYLVRTGEVNLTRPSGDELQFTNPLLLLRSYKKGFNLSYIGESTGRNGKMADDVKLVSKDNREIETIELQLERSTSLPLKMVVTMKHNLRSVIQINRMQTGLNLPDELFVFNPADYPDVEEIDLR